jgi:hypothetical protein
MRFDVEITSEALAVISSAGVIIAVKVAYVLPTVSVVGIPPFLPRRTSRRALSATGSDIHDTMDVFSIVVDESRGYDSSESIDRERRLGPQRRGLGP